LFLQQVQTRPKGDPKRAEPSAVGCDVSYGPTLNQGARIVKTRHPDAARRPLLGSHGERHAGAAFGSARLHRSAAALDILYDLRDGSDAPSAAGPGSTDPPHLAHGTSAILNGLSNSPVVHALAVANKHDRGQI
jgi:hypothetical protein